MQNILLNAVNKSLNVKDSLDKDEYEKIWHSAYLNFQLSPREFILYKELGENISGNILDVGSGNCMTAQAIIQNCKNRILYHSIDVKDFPIDVISNLITNNKIKEHKHFKYDVYKDEINLNDNKYDIIIIDIEPHGSEIKIYEKFKKYMANEHLCILKHVARIDMFGQAFADKFIHKFLNNIRDYFAESDLVDGMRDIFLVMHKDDILSDIQAQKLAKGKFASYYLSEQTPYCLEYFA